MMHEYLPIVVLIAFCTFLAVAILLGAKIISYVLGANKPNAQKRSTYECGFEPQGDARLKFDVRFYLVAILFIVFDLEIAFIFPWAIVFRHLSLEGILAMGLFILLLTVGFIYEWKQGALEWE